ncbi:MAG: hypothetical protein H2B05_03965 [Nitrosopumilaceae archaeon]|jgi:outer membrane biosynthesis protein TonB|uniref:Uncharacterized protein n=3 Tax=Candidatus Nitrosomaritimum aestuariumsis TaxID=3342354 RepID=A0AC60W322_9ARCH|nr:hypothetical protein [Nitrosopumilaceae archaeon]MBA4454080.1 hypothetical protein [Nitrosopumilaceae archaeon]MBA4459633.1 hypothetical protein [Nitrosopumilaceae archaeon]MBA4461151.1 hypothetical protein [Nitrosopumilaceae archaeon]MBA4463830.1 hypothetical protein [Nitrosopumilaceae archaeon]
MISVIPAYSQEPGPPKIPEPSPEPQPIPIPEPEPIREPFPEESDTEKIQRLTKENAQLKEENLQLKIQVTELNKIIENLQAITLEQIKVIMQLVQQLQEAIFSMPYSSPTNL